MPHSHLSKILVALSPQRQGDSLNDFAIKNLCFWTEKFALSKQTSVEAVYVLPEVKIDLKIGRVKKNAMEVLKKNLQRIRLNIGIKPRVICSADHSRHGSVKGLLHYARENNAKLIIVISHGREGIARLIFGSFAETLLAQSWVPILFIGVKTAIGIQSKKVIFITDFSPESETAFKLFLAHVESFNPEVLIYYAHSELAEIYNYNLMGISVPFASEQDYITQKAFQLERSGEWLNVAREFGISARFISHAKAETTLDTLHEITNFANQEQVALIGTSSGIEENVARELYRKERYNVWVCGPKVIEPHPKEKI